MFGISPTVHDLIFSIGAFILLLGMVPQIVQGTVVPTSSCIMIGSVLAVFTLNYLTMEYWYVMAVEGVNVLAWTILLRRALRARTGVVCQS